MLSCSALLCSSGQMELHGKRVRVSERQLRAQIAIGAGAAAQRVGVGDRKVQGACPAAVAARRAVGRRGARGEDA